MHTEKEKSESSAVLVPRSVLDTATDLGRKRFPEWETNPEHGRAASVFAQGYLERFRATAAATPLVEEAAAETGPFTQFEELISEAADMLRETSPGHALAITELLGQAKSLSSAVSNSAGGEGAGLLTRLHAAEARVERLEEFYQEAEKKAYTNYGAAWAIMVAGFDADPAMEGGQDAS